jgi:GDSL-like Lipase/Acylhydrolase family
MHPGDLGYICALMAGDSLQPRRPHRLLLAIAGMIAGLVAVAALSIAAALAVTPLQTVQVAGQVIKVGAAPALSTSGPGQVSLFGQTLPTEMSFPGPIRPRLELSQITLNSELTNFVEGATPTRAGSVLRADLLSGWERYFGWEAAAAGLTSLLLAGAVAGWRRLPVRSTVKVLALALVVTELLNLGAIAIAANGARHALANVHSLNQLVGSTPAASQPVRKHRRVVTGVQEVVMGDSTAAGAGLPLVADPSAVDRACGRSSESYATSLAAANGWKAVNLACDSATVRHGMLGSQAADGLVIPAQMGFASEISHPSVVIVSIGADDLQWAAILQVCAVSATCDNRASAAYFQQKLAAFSADYLQLLIRLGSLSGHPRVIINRYYDPFGTDIGCITSHGLTASKIATISTWLNALNQVLAKGAAQFGFLSPQPSFAGHQLCSPQPYVQGLAAKAPFHPTPLGQLAIALADQAAIARAATAPATPAPSSTATTGTGSATPAPAASTSPAP